MFCFCRFLFKGCFNNDDNDDEYDASEHTHRRHIPGSFGEGFFWRTQNPFNIGGRIGPRVSHLRANLYPTPDLLPPKYEDAIKIPTSEPPPVYSENGSSEVTLQPPSYENSITPFPPQIPTGSNNNVRRELRIPEVSVTTSSQPFPSQFQIIYNNNTLNRQLDNNSERVRCNSIPGTYNTGTGGTVMYLQYSGIDNDELPGSVNNDLERNKILNNEGERIITRVNIETLSPKLIKQKSNSTDSINERKNQSAWKVRLPNSARYPRNSSSKIKNTQNNQPEQLNILTISTLN
ncbi:Hypothetical protein SRAE_1000034600 [Strongyloides ratti]|uniref:Uncharacterized protein n=1 Tax=Strongyloides ratti TaxID=34506 RepID=A0A090L1S7_STRRB|nr:Hypothetical protein SRAE_1000034600 [Strongyloides ratti]CEF62072.1 Hypothetical protein SRAE_1000034600 [Strongyloides ratti]